MSRSTREQQPSGPTARGDDTGMDFDALLHAVAAAPERPVPMELAPGTLVNDTFRIERRLGAGAMGVVYRARDLRLERDVAIKIHRSPSRERGLERLLREAQTMARLSHPNVVAVHEVGTVREHLFVAMAFVDGTTARAWLAAEPRTTDEILEVYHQAGLGLAAAHAAHIIHRDFKPDNVLIGCDGCVQVADFGLARPLGAAHGPAPARDAGDASVTATGAIAGTPAYMAPEQWSGHELDARADQFSFCAALFEALTGQLPFPGETPEAIRDSIARGDLRSPPGRSVPRRVLRVLRRGLHAAPAARYPDMTALLRALHAARAGRRRLWMGLAALGVAAAVVIASLIHERHQRVALCRASGVTASEVWSPARAAEVERVFHAAGAPGAAAWRVIGPALTRYAGELGQAYVAACEAARVQRTQSEVMYGRRAECLQRRRRALAAVARVLGGADAVVIENAAAAVARLPPVSACADEVFLLAQIEPPASPEQRRRVRAFRDELSELLALVQAGKGPGVVARARDTRDAVAELGYEPLLAEALLHLGRVERAAENVERAREALVESFLSARRSGHDEVAAEAAAMLVYVVGHDQARLDEAGLWARLAQVELARGAREVEAQVLDAVALQAELGGDNDAALGHRRRILELFRSRYGDHHPQTAAALNGLAVVLDGMGRYQEAGAAYERALAGLEAYYGADHPALAVVLSNVGLFQAGQGQFEQAVARLERAVAISEAAAGPDSVHVAYAMLNLGVALHGLGDRARAVSAYERALAILEARLGPEHPDVALCLNSLALTHTDSGDHARATALHRRALAITEKLGPTHPLVAELLQGFGHTLVTADRAVEAIPVLERALAAWEASDPGNPRRAAALAQLGQALLAARRPADAIAPLERALAFADATALGPEDQAAARFALGRAYWDTARDAGAARRLVQQALDFYRAHDHDRAAAAVAWLDARAESR